MAINGTRFKINPLKYALIKQVFSELLISGEIAGNMENLAFFSVLVIFNHTVDYIEQLIMSILYPYESLSQIKPYI